MCRVVSVCYVHRVEYKGCSMLRRRRERGQRCDQSVRGLYWWKDGCCDCDSPKRGNILVLLSRGLCKES
jgi:hypothetical protein